jgi:PIN domain nuclease of toxin-antitoxin system
VARDYVLDTHASVFMLTVPRRLGKAARSAIERVEEGQDQAWLPAAVVAEMLILRDPGRVRLGLPDLRRAMEAAPALRFLPLDLTQLDLFASLASLRDPSAARSIGAMLVTRDGAIADTGLVETVWS